MSCFIVTEEHIYYLASLALGCKLEYAWGGQTHRIDTPERAAKLADSLMTENHNSYAHRYNEFYNIEAFKPELIRPVSGDDADVAQMTKSIDCYTYQSCERGGWVNSQTYAAMVALRLRCTEGVKLYAGHHSDDALYPAGWEEAKWGCCPRFKLPEADSPTLKPADLKASAYVALRYLEPYLPPHQAEAIKSNLRGEEGEYFMQLLCDLAEQFMFAPRTYDQSDVRDPIAHFHYFKGGYDCYVTELDIGDPECPDDLTQHQVRAYARYDHMPEYAELSYAHFPELFESKVDLDFHWEPTPLSEIKRKHAKAS